MTFRPARHERERVGPDGWVQGWGLHYEPFEETGIRGDLFDAVAAGQPMLLEFFDGHTALANRAALDAWPASRGPVAFDEEAASSASTAFPPGAARMGRDAARAERCIPEVDAETRYTLVPRRRSAASTRSV